MDGMFKIIKYSLIFLQLLALISSTISITQTIETSIGNNESLIDDYSYSDRDLWDSSKSCSLTIL
jgi:hypothetical protein